MYFDRWLIALIVLGIATSFVNGDDKPAGDAARLSEAQKKAIEKAALEKFDTNKDGMLSEAEKAAAAEALKQKGMLPGSGIVPGSEEFLKKFDRNGDGKLSDAEKQAAQSAWQKMRAGGGSGPIAGGNPGGLPVGQAGAAASDAADKPAKKINPLIKRYDKDGDGKLNEEEKAALQADRKAKRGDKSKAGEPPA